MTTTDRQAAGPIAPEALEQIFTGARTHNGWLPKDVPDSLLELAVDYAKWGPTSANCSPMRIIFVRSPEAKARLAPAMSDANRPKTMAAPATAIVAYDLNFTEKSPAPLSGDGRAFLVPRQ